MGVLGLYNYIGAAEFEEKADAVWRFRGFRGLGFRDLASKILISSILNDLILRMLLLDSWVSGYLTKHPNPDPEPQSILKPENNFQILPTTNPRPDTSPVQNLPAEAPSCSQAYVVAHDDLPSFVHEECLLFSDSAKSGVGSCRAL